MENLQQILDRFLGFFQSLPDIIGRLWETIDENATAIGVVISFLALLVAVAGLMGWRRRSRNRKDTPPTRRRP